MKLSTVKFIHTVYFDGQDRLFVDSTKDHSLAKIEMIVDTKSNLLKIIGERDTVLVPMSNVTWFKVSKLDG